ncbi:3-oxo-5-alpha-steroid 4-dehydrogenase-domain-containing protein [Aspergillus alliaceus]|uniref:very-long-chain enoyl-CoA reductase n=1 Tax=Petromyces alliaceus TaxID=209559 RepID=A0A5N7CD38_PETAA|nr:3-oxo-5-alpha-steroid 4-dehydrogenase-domain-containing protein [Aspergillus alliaceus]
MAPATITLIVEPRGRPIKKLPKEVQISPNAPAQEIYTTLAAASGFSIHRLRITKGSDRSVVPNSRDTKVDATGLKERSVVHVKDLGPQIGWRTVFIIEYFGPLVIPALFLYPLRPYLYYNFDKPLLEPSYLQKLVCALLSLHFLKREFETIFIHRFSNATMPARNIFKNSAHYWILAGLNIAYWVFRPDASAATNEVKPALLYTGLGLFTFGELANLNAHLVLRDLRRPGTTDRGIPSGFGFNLVTCPNYLFEIIAWVGIYLVSGLNWSVLFFITVGGAQMAAWAKKKERRYRKEFGGKYKRKSFVILPGAF